MTAAARVLARRLGTVLFCSSVALAAYGKPVEREHDVQHLLVEIPDFDNDVSIIDEPVGASSSRFTERPEKTPEQLAREVERWVTTVVAPAGSNPAPRVDLKSKRLRVTLEDADHKRLADAIARDRVRRMTQVVVEARLLGGVQLDWGPGSERLRDKVALAMLPGAAGVSLDDDEEVKQLLRVAQAGEGSRVVTAPRVTLFNGQRAYVLMSTQHAYVKDMFRRNRPQPEGLATRPATSPADAVDVETGVTASGLLLDVRPAVGPNNNVALALRFEFADLLGMSEVPPAGAPPGSEDRVQVPNRDTIRIDRTTNLRDGGSRLFYAGGSAHPSQPNGHHFLIVKTNVVPPSASTK